MTYLEDPDLAFLGTLESGELDTLVCLLTHDEKGEKRRCGLSDSPLYKEHYPDHKAYWQLAAAEIQLSGAHSIASLFRGRKGVTYREILGDLCKKLGTDCDPKAPIVELESAFLAQITSRQIEEMTAEQRQTLSRELMEQAKDSKTGLSAKVPALCRDIAQGAPVREQLESLMRSNPVL
ncbi:MAG: DUF3944 domain-containing protein, partial [Desulfovibrionaceae bacterium]|nr:DUF3944 domain-containing protein [Desulfovibrionaceae bacterium]